MLIANYKAIKFIDSAEFYVNKGLAIYPLDTKFLRQKVIADYRHKKYKDMLNHLKRLDSLHYEKLFVYKNTGLAHLILGDLFQAEEYLHQALQEDYKDAFTYYYLGLLYKKQMDYKKARQYLLLAVKKKKPSLDKEFYELGMIAKRQGSIKQAISFFQQAFDNNPNNADALLQWAMMSEVYYKSPDMATKYYQRYLDLFQNKDAEKTKFAQQQLSRLKQKAFLMK